MPFTGVAESKQLTAMTAVLDEFCEERGIHPDSAERAEIARCVFLLFEGGWRTPEELKLALSMARPQAAYLHRSAA